MTLTVRDGDTVLGTVTETVTAYAPAAGTVAVQTAPAVAGERTTVRDQRHSRQDITFEVRRRAGGAKRRSARPAGPGELGYSSPVAATDTVTAPRLDAEPDVWHRRRRMGRSGPVGAAELWDGETLAGWSAVGAGSFSPQLPDALAASAGTDAAPTPASSTTRAREFKDFELSVDYRVAATDNNGGVLLRFPKPATSPTPTHGYQVAILDNGAAARAHRRDPQERGTATPFAAVDRDQLQAHARVEHAEDPRRRRPSRCC